MHAKVLRIHWHDKQPVFSVDFDPNDPDRLFTAGGDNNVRIWRLKGAKDDVEIEYRTTLNRHIKSVNCVRFSHSGDMVASAGDGGSVIVWRPLICSTGQSRMILGTEGEEDDSLENWSPLSILRASDTEDIYDLSWSPDDKFILIGLTDNTAQLWDLAANKCIRVMRDHSHFVQGVAWDPLGKYLVTESADRTTKIWQLSTRKSGVMRVASINKLNKTADQQSLLFHDETLVSFFRKPAFSPDGALLLLPAGLQSGENCIHILSRACLTAYPIAYIKGFDKAVLGIRFNARLFGNTLGITTTLFKFDYRMIYAAFTMESIYVFDTCQLKPIAIFRDLHYGSITDLAWSPDGHILFITSTDGFCSIVTFERSELGDILSVEEEMRIIGKIKKRLNGYGVNKHDNMIFDESSKLPTSDPITIESMVMEESPLPGISTEVGKGSEKRRIQPSLVSKSFV